MKKMMNGRTLKKNDILLWNSVFVNRWIIIIKKLLWGNENIDEM